MIPEPPAIKWSELTHYNPKQLTAHEAMQKYKYVLYGGAMGGGKSYWLRWSLIWLLMHYASKTGLKGIRVGLFCEDYPSLDDRHLSKIAYELPAWLGTLNKSSHEYTLNEKYGSGVLALRNLDKPEKYASSEFAAVGVDELTKNLENVFHMLRTRIRWPGIEDTKFLAGTNPGSVGHLWVKKLWLDREFPENEQESDQFVYIRATAHDNDKNLPSSYFKQLEGLPEEKRKAFLNGDWNLFEGQFFSEWNEDVHVVDAFNIPDTWKKVGAYDHGRAKPATFAWYAIDFDGNIYKYRELYVNKEDGSSRWEAEQIAKDVFKITEQAGEFLDFVIADSAIFTKTGNEETIADIFMKNGVGKAGGCIPMLLPSVKGRGSRISGWGIMHQYLYHDDLTPPKFRYFRNCYDSIRTIPMLVYDTLVPEDLDSDGEDHAADTDRYLLVHLRNRKTKPPKRYEEKRMEAYHKKIGLISDDFTGLQRFNNL